MLQPLQTVTHSQPEVCRPQQSLTAAIFMFLQPAKKNVHSNCPTWFTPLGSKKTRTVASEQTATVANLDTPSVSALHIEKIANIGVISRTFATDNKEERPQQLPSTVCSIGQQENTCTGASEQTAAVANLATPSVRGLHVDKIANSGAILRAFATGNKEQCLQPPSDTVCTTEQLVHARAGASELAATSADHFSSSERFAGCKNR